MLKKILVAGSVAAALVLLLFLYFSFVREQRVATFTGVRERLVIGNIGEHSLLNLVAKEKGFFEQVGIDAEVREYASGPAAMNDLVAGTVDVAVAADFVGVRTIFTNDDVRILASSSKHEAFYVVALRDRGIEKPEDLRGKMIGVTTKSAGEFFLGRFLSINNVRFDEVGVVDMPPDALTASLTAGELDAIVIFDPHAYRLGQSLGNRVLLWPAQGNQKIFNVHYAMDAFVQGRAAVAARYIEALIMAEAHIKEDPEGAQSILKAARGYESAYIAHMWPKFEFSVRLDQELLLSMEDEARWALENGVATEERAIPNYLDFIAFDPLEAVQRDRVAIVHE